MPTCTEEDTHEHVDYAYRNEYHVKEHHEHNAEENTQELGVEADWLILTFTSSHGIISRATLHCMRNVREM